MFFIKSKKGEKLLSIYWFVILFIVAGAVVYMAAVFYGNPYDVREIEANLMVDHVSDCISEGGLFRESFFNQSFLINESNFLDECGINFEVEDTFDWDDDQFFIEVNVENFDTQQNVHNFEIGNINLQFLCDKQGDTLPFCLNRSFYVLDSNKDAYEVNILSVVRKTEKNE